VKPTDSLFWKGIMGVNDAFLVEVLLCWEMGKVLGFWRITG
jgi:hypothetical protein